MEQKRLISMKRYIDAEKLKYEIERRKLSNYYTDTNDYEAELFEIIDSLQQEQPEVDLEKASRNVYESWMGGTMDDVRRDMVELGNVLNARKED